ncbi:hypothetical protein TVAG_230850 [Trichomonas vaginalis G3]|uniref:receptor protein-tyrosine kinase n=1 Tax=Trichomonas vaginalis (strain ATCC PRA-98 / G3) TaxID=412133 RepID=A2EE13_TRIV3|nr:glycine-rich protein family [Trichomonas vaginalis G3]EAY09125.1 hypothetical protein TVAG_230850 [Trichomonas vaginalis G3]KAI5502643.1 glycine-rich protein family [Trichomonas vaginalis G3]|eukprot:XP_001321348.1 hypothetical protein [Trichomonas vaginalis G3]
MAQTYDVDKMVKGGYGGGGYSVNYYASSTQFGAGSGGGQTAVKFLQNDLWHRVIVSGGGGGSDNVDVGAFMSGDDGSGGAGGGLVAQIYWVDGQYITTKPANSTFGFTFGSGESAQATKSKNENGVQTALGGYDKSGAGSGWFGGFASHHGNGGSGGGSSWALSMDAEIPTDFIPAKGPFFDQPDSKKYFFSLNDGFIFTDVKSFPGIREGNGRLVITVLQFVEKPSLRSNCYWKFGYEILFIQLISQA